MACLSEGWSLNLFCRGQAGILGKHLFLCDNWYSMESQHFSQIFSAPEKASFLFHGAAHGILISESKELEKALNIAVKAQITRIPPRPAPQKSKPVWKYILEEFQKTGLFQKPHLHHLPGINKKEPAKHPKILLHPGSGSTLKNWPLAHFLLLYEKLENNGLFPAFIVGQDDNLLFQQIKTMPDKRIYTAHHILDFWRLLHKASAYVGNDSGASHAAGLSGIPALVLFGPTDEKRWTPWGPLVKSVCGKADCRPCFEIHPNHRCENRKCISSITVDHIEKVLHDLLNTTYTSN